MQSSAMATQARLTCMALLAGKRALMDVKTGTFVAPEFGLQLAAYGAR